MFNSFERKIMQQINLFFSWYQFFNYILIFLSILIAQVFHNLKKFEILKALYLRK